jgi:2-keto-4-pentenoate hydratase/2-oxohepta-3-ene-1,7-dioic acid hydratase in catechol pathway
MKIARVLNLDDNHVYYGILRDMFYPIEENLLLQLAKGKNIGEIKVVEKGVSLDKVRFLSPTVPSKIVAVGLNYKSHAAELMMELPDEPLIFLKAQSAVIGDGDYIELPPSSKRVDYEGELAVVIGKKAKNVSKENAKQYILGYSCFNDVTARDFQRKDIQFTRGKSFDTFAPYGPCIETEIDPANLNISTFINGKEVQKCHTSDSIFGVEELVSFISGVMTLYPGDIIPTGTPSGIGHLHDGDKVEVVIEGIGKLTNYAKKI